MPRFIKSFNWPLFSIIAIFLAICFGGYKVFEYVSAKTESFIYAYMGAIAYTVVVVAVIVGIVWGYLNYIDKQEDQEHDPY